MSVNTSRGFLGGLFSSGDLSISKSFRLQAKSAFGDGDGRYCRHVHGSSQSLGRILNYVETGKGQRQMEMGNGFSQNNK